MTVRKEMIKVRDGFELPIELVVEEIDGDTEYTIYIDGVFWTILYNEVHAVVLFEMMKDHITEYMHYEKR